MLRSQKEAVGKGRRQRQVLFKLHSLSEEASELGVQSISEQVNWTNTALRGMATHTFVTNDYARKWHIRDLQVSTNTIAQSINQINDRVADIYDHVGKTQNIVIQKTEDFAKNHEELMEGLG
jgi:archaellum component FlaC